MGISKNIPMNLKYCDLYYINFIFIDYYTRRFKHLYIIYEFNIPILGNNYTNLQVQIQIINVISLAENLNRVVNL